MLQHSSTASLLYKFNTSFVQRQKSIKTNGISLIEQS